MITSEEGLLGVLGFKKFDAIVVEGYDGVGKGRVLSQIATYYNKVPYRPDYNLWQKHDVRKQDRWKMSGFFWDIFSHFDIHPETPLLFDRGCISGAVYAEDTSILEDYRELLRDMRVLHILVDCSSDDFCKFQLSRNPNMDKGEILKLAIEKEKYTARYMEYLYRAGVDWIVYQNRYEEDLSEVLSKTCEGCGHYSYGVCRHPLVDRRVSPTSSRCSLSYDKETQDMEVLTGGTEMQCV